MGLLERIQNHRRKSDQSDRKIGFSSEKPEDNFPIKLETQEDLRAYLESILPEIAKDSRQQTYTIALSQIPIEVIQKASRVLEVGMNWRIFKFANIFTQQPDFFGLTLSPEHSREALQSAGKFNLRADVRLEDIQEGLPNEWQGMDFAVDIYSASHYFNFEKTIQMLAEKLRAGGYLLVVPGGSSLLDGFAEVARRGERVSDFNFRTLFRYDRSGHPKLETEDAVSLFGRENQESVSSSLCEISKELRKLGFSVSSNPSEQELMNYFGQMADILGEDVITGFDLLIIKHYKAMRAAGLGEILRFLTPDDGIGYIARKSDEVDLVS